MVTNIGVLALQGAFREHVTALNTIGVEQGVVAVEVRLPEDLVGLDGLVIPGGESTAMSHLAGKRGMTAALEKWVGEEKPTWGTCAGMILLAKEIVGKSREGQLRLNAMDITVSRNFFGSQLGSFVENLETTEKKQFKAVFIRAPAALQWDDSKVQVLATLDKELLQKIKAQGSQESDIASQPVAVALRQKSFLATAFHPELTSDRMWHQMFIDMVKKS